jgi:hypothetical protein
MREYAITLLVALVAGLAGGVAARSLGGWMRRLRGVDDGRRHPSPLPQHDEGSRQLELVRDDLWAIKDAVNRVLQDLGDLSRRLETAPGGAAAPPAAPGGDRFSPRPRASEPPRHPGGSAGPEAGGLRDREPLYRQPPPVRYSPYDAPPGPYDVPPGHSLDALSTRAYDAPRERESAPHPAAGPPPNAVNVEARDDRIVASSSYPPEAWLEPRGPAVAHLWLNPVVALNENALRRLSTFFHWQPERPGATYDTEQPAVLRWDEGQRVGTVSQRGTARPR